MINHTSYLIISISFFFIALSLFFLWYKRHNDIPTPHIYILFVLLMLLCSSSHFFHFLKNKQVIINLVFALTALATALILPIKIYYLLSLPSFSQMYNLINDYTKELENRRRLQLQMKHYNNKLKLKIVQLKSELSAHNFSEVTCRSLTELNDIVIIEDNIINNQST